MMNIFTDDLAVMIIHDGLDHFIEKRSWVMSGGRMSPLALGRHGSPSLSPTNSIDKTPVGLQRMYSVDLPTVTAGTMTTTPLDHRQTGEVSG